MAPRGALGFRLQPRKISIPPLIPRSEQREEFVDFSVLKSDIIGPGGNRAESSYQRWISKAHRDNSFLDIQDFVHKIDHKTLHGLTVDEVDRVTSHPNPRIRTGHAIGDIRNKEDGVTKTRDFNTPWAMHYLLHGLLERKGALPRWEDFDRFLRGPARLRYYQHFCDYFRYDTLPESEKEALERGFQYRVGNAYYSFLREVDLMTRLREEHKLPIRYHVLADVQYRVDFWCKNVLVALWITNPRYRQGESGRKQQIEQHVDASGFRILKLELVTPDRSAMNQPSLVTPSEIARAADLIRAALQTN